MAFLDNSGDIILDAVLTDTGRMRLARGDGSFKIAKFALGDDEIDYESYNGAHPSGSAYYDLEILQTPIFEAFTNNSATMKTKLVSLSNNNLLYLPVMKINNKATNTQPTAAGAFAGSGSHVCYVDDTTRQYLFGDSALSIGAIIEEANAQGYLNGANPRQGSNRIRVDQGLNTTEVSPSLVLDPELKETQYIVEIDSRFAKIYDTVGTGDTITAANPSFIDDDSLASYYFTAGQGGFVMDSIAGPLSPTGGPAEVANEMIEGPRGTRLTFGLLAATDLVSSDYLFTTLGSSTVQDSVTWYFIDSTIRVTGVTTGYRLDIPIRFLKVNK